MKGKVSKKGFKRNSPDVDNDYNVIPSNRITMNQVDFPVYGVDNFGNKKLMMPGGEYQFPGADYVTEFPIRKQGGPSPAKAKKMLHEGTANGQPLTEQQRKYFGWLAYGQFGKSKKQLGGAQDFFLNKLGFSAPYSHAEELGEQNNPEQEGDAIRHASAAAEAVKHLNKWYNPLTYTPGANFAIANLMGIGHELASPDNTTKEHLSDIYNNFVGGLVGEIPFLSQKNRDKAILKLQKIGALHTIKQDGGEQQDISPEEAAQILADGFYNGVVLSDEQANYLQNIVDSADQNDQEEFRHGGHHRGRTSKNIKSSVNELFLRNYHLYGPQGRHIYDPNVKDEGMNYISHPAQYWQHMQDGGENFDIDNDGDFDFDQMKRGGWIKSAIKHPGRCTPGSPNYDCPKGSPQWNLAQRFKHGDLHKKQEGGEQFEDFDVDTAYDDYLKYGGIHIKESKKGTFTSAATKHKMGVQEFAHHVMSNKDKFTPAMRRKANFAIQASKWKKQFGGEEMTDYENPFFQVGGGFVPPQGAQKVGSVDTSYNFLGTSGGKKYFDKQIGQATPGSQTKDPNAYHNWLVQQAQSGVSPDQLVKKGYLSADKAGAYQQFYKPVYTETETPNSAQPSSIPLNNEWLKDHKETADFTNPNWRTLDFPDPSAGYSKATRVYLDRATGRPVDTMKSFSTGKYNPVFIEPPVEIYKAQKKRFDYNDRPVVDTKAAYSAGFKKGGEPCFECGGAYKTGGDYLRALVNGAYKDVAKKQKGGESLLQGMNGDEYLAGRSGTFKNYLANNTMKAVAMEEISNLEQLHNQMKAQYGGGYYQQGGSFDPADSLDQAQEFAGYYQQPTANTGTTSNPMPEFNPMDYLDRETSGDDEQVPLTPQQEFQSYMNRRAAIEPNADFSKPKVEFNSTNKKYPWGMLAAEGIIGGMNLASSFLNGKNTAAYNKWLNMQTDADHVFKSNPANGANRGMYETNTGMFKPNQYAPAFHKDGGETYMSQKQIDHLRSLGYKIEILD